MLVQTGRVWKSAPRVLGTSGPTVGTVSTGQAFNLIAIGDSIISGVGALTLADALVGQTALHLSEALACRVNWVAYGSIGARSGTVISRLVPLLPDTEADFMVLSIGVNGRHSVIGCGELAKKFGRRIERTQSSFSRCRDRCCRNSSVARIPTPTAIVARMVRDSL